jgi:hypothetical protein
MRVIWGEKNGERERERERLTGRAREERLLLLVGESERR